MQIGVQIPDFSFPNGPAKLGADLAAVGRAADEAGFDFIAVMDHFFQIRAIGPPEREMLEAYTTLGYLAAATSRAKLLTLVFSHLRVISRPSRRSTAQCTRRMGYVPR